MQYQNKTYQSRVNNQGNSTDEAPRSGYPDVNRCLSNCRSTCLCVLFSLRIILPVGRRHLTRFLSTTIAIGLGTILLTSCAAPPKPIPVYVAPTTGRTAKLVIRASAAAGETYGVYLLRNSEQCADPRKIGEGSATSHPATTALTANMLTTIELFFLKTNQQYCSIRFTFTPLAGKSYLFNGTSVETKCLANMLDATDPEDIKPAPAVLWRNPTTSSCLSLSQSRAAPVQEIPNGLQKGDAVLKPGATSADLHGLIQK